MMRPTFVLMWAFAGVVCAQENPASWPMPMVMGQYGGWSTMFMGVTFVSDIQQTGPRGGDKLYSSNWMMASAEHAAGTKGTFATEVMLSLEPATITERRYPLLFQTGETAFGRPLIDAQHPHNFVMEAGFRYKYKIGGGTTLEAYLAPVGDPALGPVAFPHRASAAEIPQAPISHHWQDSTHISDDVVTLGVRHGMFKAEASGFHGAEPGENRWTVQQGAVDSWSGRLWFFPTENWAAQVSAGRLSRPEALEPGDQVRVTASAQYTRPMKDASWSSSFIWGRDHSTATRRNLNSYLVESVLPVGRRDFITGRAELVDKDELDIDPELGAVFRIGAYTIGYTHDIDLFSHFETGVGFNFTTYTLPRAIKPDYGNHPVGGNVFIRFRLKG